MGVDLAQHLLFVRSGGPISGARRRVVVSVTDSQDVAKFVASDQRLVDTWLHRIDADNCPGGVLMVCPGVSPIRYAVSPSHNRGVITERHLVIGPVVGTIHLLLSVGEANIGTGSIPLTNSATNYVAPSQVRAGVENGQVLVPTRPVTVDHIGTRMRSGPNEWDQVAEN